VLNPVYYAVSGVMWVWHQLFGAILGPSSGLAWALSVIFLVITLRAIMLKPFISQMRSARQMRLLAPQMTKLRERYKNDKVKLAEETRKLQSDHGVNMLAGCLPALLQLPVFIGLLHVLRSFNRPGLSFEENAAIANYAFPPDLVRSFLEARLFGTPLSAWVSMSQEQLDSFGAHVEHWEVYAVAVPLMLIAAVATHFSARHSLELQAASGQSNAQMMSIMKYTPWLFPLGVIAGGLFGGFPVAILLYWLTNNVWTLVQQRLVHGYLDRHPVELTKKPATDGGAPATDGPAPRLAPKPGAKPVKPSVSAGVPRGGSTSNKPKRNSSGHRPSKRRR
jgi:YidC/Oxa1 family membrane protein insertase